MLVTNLRNRPLSDSNVDSMSNLVLSLYHNLVTGDKDFPFIPIKGYFRSDKLVTPFPHTGHTENATPSPLTVSPPGVIVPPAGSNFPPQFLSPVLPEKADLYVLKADRRNCVSTLDVDGIVTRVISTVYRNEDTEMAKRWRVTDYSAEGNVLMSVLCQFSEKSAQRAKRKPTEEESNNGSPAFETVMEIEAFPGELVSSRLFYF